jgi:phage/plasmid-associated DNA primase
MFSQLPLSIVDKISTTSSQMHTIGFVQEPENCSEFIECECLTHPSNNDHVIDIKILSSLCSGDSIKVRDMYNHPLIFTENKIPRIENEDKALWRRKFHHYNQDNSENSIKFKE